MVTHINKKIPVPQPDNPIGFNDGLFYSPKSSYKPGWFEKLLIKLDISRFDIMKLIDGKEDFYLRRYHLIRNDSKLSPILKWLTKGKYDRMYLHHILRWDEDRDLHNHPWIRFAIFVLKGGYIEEIPHPKFEKWWRPGKPMLDRYWGQFSFRSSDGEQYHRIIKENFKPSWTLFFAGPVVRKWQFMTEKGPVDWDIYLSVDYPEQVSGTDKNRKDPDSI